MNNLWKPEMVTQPKVKVTRNPPANGFDAVICKPCENRGVCLHICAPLKWIDGNVPRRETFIDANMDHYQSADYKETLADHAAFFDREGTGEAIRGMKTGRPKAIAALLYFGFLKQDVKRLLHIPHSSFYEIVKRGRGK